VTLHQLDFIRADRTRIVTRQKCPKERMLGYHMPLQNGLPMGLMKRGSKYEASFGALLHELLACVLLGRPVDTLLIEAMGDLSKICTDAFPDLEAAEKAHFVKEQQWLLRLLVHGWAKFRLPAILRDYEVVSVEKEHEVTFQPSDYLPDAFANMQRPLVIPFRFDALLRDKSSGMLYIMDWKTTKAASEDWNIALDNSLQSNLYIEGAQKLYPDEIVGGIFYEGLVKGYRQMDNARSSKYQGQVIQYGSPLYGWHKGSVVYKDYAAGRMRHFMPDTAGFSEKNMVESLTGFGWNIPQLFPSTMPWKPLNIGHTIGQVIVNENTFRQNLEFWLACPKGSAEKTWYENILFEQHLDNCFKYGSKHPCQFVDICHGGIHEEEIANIYEQRVPHHAGE
jgi:hypothetical protein